MSAAADRTTARRLSLIVVALAMIIVWAKTGVAWMERSLRSVIQVLLAERMIMAQISSRSLSASGRFNKRGIRASSLPLLGGKQFLNLDRGQVAAVVHRFVYCWEGGSGLT